ncbi:MAG: hypothetical protein H6702_02420 [Myxococcales bacterium]|nr:hypothetical protein [Myxococcales bacterium]
MFRRVCTRASLALALLFAWGCDDEGGDSAPVEPLPEYSDGHWAKAQRGVALDDEDVEIFSPSAVDPAAIADDFGLLVMNRPFHNRLTGCPSEAEAPMHLPRQTAERLLDRDFAAAGVDYQNIAVNVDLLSPGRGALLALCTAGNTPRFDNNAHRAAVLAAFEDLARLPGIDHITVGLEMNRYYHLSIGGARRDDDYSNWVTLYREVYAAIKAVNPAVKVGPGIHWGTFMRLTVPEVAAEYGLIEAGSSVPDADLKAAVEFAARRTVWPLLRAGLRSDAAPSADYLAISMIPRQQEPPFNGNPAGEVEAEVLRHYQYVPEVALGLPVVLPQIDWETQSGANANSKGTYLTLLKKALSHTPIEWAAWRRLVDIPEILDGPINPCGAYTGDNQTRDQSSLYYSVDYCFSGMISDRAQIRGVYNIFTANP